ncbi:hypothetical protein ABIE26_002523 [Pedobacter africanus]|uniref:Uncharacterized protein n=1 Tax=Pedobacter africanus TaxID=151894 RepID=A0ACC6KY89_9SPHI|nr:glycosyltransferase family A protein [Pedobacter africanus]MDR6784088.1 hypothetical protein [Pedobacter africanus]
MKDMPGKRRSNNQAFLILSDCVSESLIRLYLQVKIATANLGETFIVYHNRADKPEKRLYGYNVYEFTDSILKDLDYQSVRDTLVPGSNHFPILKFHLDNPNYDYYWCIEDDIVFNGEWSSFFNQVTKKVEYDFISCFITRYEDRINQDWEWWSNFSKTGEEINLNNLIMSFNPIYSISNRAAKFLNQSLKDGWVGHHEVLMPTLLFLNKFKIKDFGGNGKFVPPGFKDKFYTDETHLWRPLFEAPENLLNKIYHPVKNRFKITGGFKYKISFCIEGVGILNSLKQTLIRNILDNQNYNNFEFIIVDYDSEEDIELWLKESLNEYINEGKVVHYKTEKKKIYNCSHAKNLAFKLASGDILCSIKAGEFTGENFAEQINNLFKINSNIVICSMNDNVYPNDFSGQNKSEKLCVKKDNFLKISGFDEQIDEGELESIDFINRLERIRINKIMLNDDSEVLGESMKNFTVESDYITLDKILVRYLDPYTSTVIFKYHTGIFEIGTIVNNRAFRQMDFQHSHFKQWPKYEFTLKGSNWTKGKWYLAEDDESLIFKTKTGDEFQFQLKDQFYETKLQNKLAVFYNITDLDIKKDLINFHYQLKTKQLFKNGTSKKDIYLNSAGFGKGIVFKNFNSDHPIVIN